MQASQTTQEVEMIVQYTKLKISFMMKSHPQTWLPFVPQIHAIDACFLFFLAEDFPSPLHFSEFSFVKLFTASLISARKRKC